MNEMLHIENLDFEVRRSDRRKTLGITVDRGGELVIHAPMRISEEELRRWARSKLLWVHRKLLAKQEQSGIAHCIEFISGETISYLGRGYRLRVVETQNEPLRFDGEWFLLRSNARSVAMDHFRRWFVSTGMPWLCERVETWVPHTGAAPSRVVVDDLGFRWGSCGKNDVVYFNWRLLQLPVTLIDYVIVHELTHLVFRNHSPEFWLALERALPDWRERKQQIESGWSLHVSL